MKGLIITDLHPKARLTEGSCSLIDFKEVLEENDFEVKFITISNWYENPQNEFWNQFGNVDLIALCLNENLEINILKRLIYQIESLQIKTKVFFQPTARYLGDEISKEVIRNIGTWHLLTNNISWLPSSTNSIKHIHYTHCIKNSWLNQSQDGPALNALAILDLLEHTQVMYTDLSYKEILPFLDAQKSRKVEKLPSLTINTNLGMSSLKTSLESLQQNGLNLVSMCWTSSKQDPTRPEYLIPRAKEIIYPSLKSKMFGRWAYLAHRLNIPIKSDHIHGYQLFQGQDLQVVISNLLQ